MKIELKSGFRRWAMVVEVLGNFPDYKVETVERSYQNTWQDDGDSSTSIEVDPADKRALFKVRFWGVSAHSNESDTIPLTEGAEQLCALPLPKGWEVRIRGENLGGATGRDAVIVGGTQEALICNLAAAREPLLRSPEQRRAAFLAAKTAAVEAWEAAGLDGLAIWEAKLSWSKEEGVIALAGKLAGRYMGASNGHRHFQELNGFRSALSHPRTQVAEKMAELTCRVPCRK